FPTQSADGCSLYHPHQYQPASAAKAIRTAAVELQSSACNSRHSLRLPQIAQPSFCLHSAAPSLTFCESLISSDSIFRLSPVACTISPLPLRTSVARRSASLFLSSN